MAELRDVLLRSEEREVWDEEGDKTRGKFRDLFDGEEPCVADFEVSEETRSSSASLQD